MMVSAERRRVDARSLAHDGRQRWRQDAAAWSPACHRKRRDGGWGDENARAARLVHSPNRMPIPWNGIASIIPP